MDREKVIKGLNDIGSFIAGRIGFEQARNFLRTIDDAIALLKEQQEMIEGTIEETRGEWPDEKLPIPCDKEREYPCDHSRRNKA